MAESEKGNVSDAYIQAYYQVFLQFLYTVGNYREIFSIGENAENGVYPVQVVARKYGYEGAALDAAIDDLDRKRRAQLDELSHWSGRTGLGRLNDAGKEKFLEFVEDPDRRRYLRDNIKRAADRGELISIRDLMLKRFALEKKKKEKLNKG